MYSDFRTNLDLGFDSSIRCHENFDFQISVQGDIMLTSTDAEAILQKLFLWMAIKEGEVPNEPDIGCCIYKYFFKKPSASNLALLERELQFQLQELIPELNIKSVTVENQSSDFGRIDEIRITLISQDYGIMNFSVSQSDLDYFNSVLAETMSIADFRYADNSMLQELLI